MSIKTIVLMTCLLLSTSCQLLFHDAGGAAGAADGGRLVDAANSDVDAGTQIDATPGERPNYIFASSETFTGDFKGRDVADKKCQNLATRSGLPGNFVAVMTNGTESPIERLGSSRGWVMTSGAPVADFASDLLNNKSMQAILRDETNSQISIDFRIWTGLVNSAAGTANNLCNDWNTADDTYSFAGDVRESNPLYGLDVRCSTRARFLCAETAHNVRVKPVVNPAKKMIFVSVSTYTPVGGLDGADRLCKAEAIAAGLAGNYRALLGDSSISALSRFDATDQYQRTDGVVIGTLANDPLASINRGADPANILVDKNVWSFNLGVPVPGDQSCNNWKSISSNDLGAYAFSDIASAEAYQFYYQVCSAAPNRVYCAQM
jgi:hypothetical protein